MIYNISNSNNNENKKNENNQNNNQNNNVEQETYLLKKLLRMKLYYKVTYRIDLYLLYIERER